LILNKKTLSNLDHSVPLCPCWRTGKDSEEIPFESIISVVVDNRGTVSFSIHFLRSLFNHKLWYGTFRQAGNIVFFHSIVYDDLVIGSCYFQDLIGSNNVDCWEPEQI
jgi:hypothetical protein